LKAKHQRLSLAVVALLAIGGAGMLALSAMKDKAAYFYTPSELKHAKLSNGQQVRLGGMVAGGSILRSAGGTNVDFVVVDSSDRIPVSFRGITPDLFKERSGVVAEGSLSPDGRFIATNLLAKHDENYKPPQLSGGLIKTGVGRP
jgi:cytochrome c-type biogenesis protein CcmE